MQKEGGNLKKFKLTALFAFLGLFLPVFSEAAVLFVSPSSGAFTVDSTFDVRVVIDTKGTSINTIDVRLTFPPDKLQVVNPSSGKSIIELWTSAPIFNNASGLIKLQGGIPGGINTSNGLVTTVTFRAKSVGTAYLKFSDDSQVLLNDGLGTKALENVYNGVYTLMLPPPVGPIVASETHPDESKYYSNKTAFLSWAHLENVRGYSYSLNKNPIDTPDNISEGVEGSVAYKNLSDGIHYFHIKALRHDSWGGTTHFSIGIDSTPPAEFSIEITPSDRTSRKTPLISFQTTDSLSGINRYELKILSIPPEKNGGEPFFIETSSPYTQTLELGSYTVIVRAYDNAVNYTESSKNFKIVTLVFEIIRDRGIGIKGAFVITWMWVWVISGSTLSVLAFIAWRVWRWHRNIEKKHENRELPHETRDKLEELKRYKKKYGKFLVLLISIIGAASLFASQAKASGNLDPPFVETVSKTISNEEIFYIGGIANTAKVEVLIYIQELEAGHVSNYSVSSDNSGEWFYSHPNFLSGGDYLVWTQARFGEELSPPSPQINVKVRETALQFGASRFSYETLYLVVIFALIFAITALIVFIVFHAYYGRKKHRRFIKELREAEEAIRRGFAILRRDIEAELEVIKRARMSKTLSAEEAERERQLLRDMEAVEKNIGKEVWDIEKLNI